ncbi:MAG: molybdopterin-guanine dinucleotide biosynthesis protein B [Dehalococcoidia bacterium]|nr:MAG: molybdopterin-guanine dinucleotide biosynthesis protein B [Dehalococcoidia bacterium]
MTVPVVSIVGRSESGKTTLIEKLVPELRKRGYRVGTIKHAQEVEFVPGKDSEHHLSAGSEITAVATAGRIVAIKPAKEPTFNEAVNLLGNELDIILCEGFKQSDTPKLEVHRKGHGTLLEGLTSLVAIISDEPLDTKVRQFSFNDIKPIADLLEKGFIKPQGNGLDLYVNGNKVHLTLFPRQFINDVVLAMTASLKDVEPVRTLALYLKKPDRGRDTGE